MNLEYIDTDCHIRWGMRRDMQQILRIESEAFDYPWREDDFNRTLRQRNVVLLVAEVCECVGGYVIYELHRAKLHVLNLAVRHDLRRVGVGAGIIAKLKSKLNAKRHSITLEVSEHNLAAQLFFKSQGFRATGIRREFFEQAGIDAYRFRYSIECGGK